MIRRWASNPYVLITAAFAASRTGYAALGVRFDATTLGFSWQFIDPYLLRHDLWRSVWYLHAQPPLYNLYLGLVLQASRGHHIAVFHVASVLAGLVLAYCVYTLLRGLGVASWIAIGLTLLLTLYPGLVLYEAWLYVEYFAGAALAAIALLIHQNALTKRPIFMGCAIGLMAILVLSRSLFHIAWLVVIVAVLAVVQADARKQIGLAGAIALALCGATYLKNYALVGSAGTTSCLGLNLHRVTVGQLGQDERDRLIGTGVLTKFAALNPYSLPLTAADAFRSAPKRGVPLLDEPLTSTGIANFNHVAYPDLCRQYERDSIRAVRRNPQVLAYAVRESTLIFFRPASNFAVFSLKNENRERLDAVSRVYDAALLLQIREPNLGGPGVNFYTPAPADFAWPNVPHRLMEVSWVLVAAYTVTFLGGIPLLRRLAATHGRSSPEVAVLAFCLATVAYVCVVGNLLEAGENNRFHVLTDPLVVIILSMMFRDFEFAPRLATFAGRVHLKRRRGRADIWGSV